MFRRILLPSDGSAAALRAARETATLFTGREDVQMVVAVAILPLDIETSDLDPEHVRSQNALLRSHAQKALEKTLAVLADKGFATQGKILEGNPTSAVIAQEAVRGDYDLIAMSSRGVGIQRDRQSYVGSVTENVIRRVGIPVLVLPARD